jgi:N-acetylmuramoyl-L-alanine amidase
MTYVVVIDAGHGGTDPGVERGTLIEKDWTLSLALNLEVSLMGLMGVMPVLIRSHDERMSLAERASLAKDLRADLAIILHVNSNEDPRVNGMWAYHWPGNAKGERVGTIIEARAPLAVRPRVARSTDAKHESWPRVRNCLAPYNCTAVLVECGFATNAEDLAELQRGEVQRGIVSAIVAGVASFLE